MTPAPEGFTWVEAARLDDLAPGSGREFIHHGRPYALFRVGDRVTALAGLCPHQKAHLASGLVDPERMTVTCPRRGCLRRRFSLETGSNADGLAVVCPVYPVKVEAGAVFVGLPDDPFGGNHHD